MTNDDLARKSGIYQILNIVNGKFYIGSAVNIYKRLLTHRAMLDINKHDNIHLQAAWNKYGEESFTFGIVEFVEDKSKLIEREQYWIDKTYCYKIGYNRNPIAGSRLGVKESLETRKKKSIAFTGRKLNYTRIITLETREKLSKARLGKPNLSTRNKSKWPCVDGWKCNCVDCKRKRYVLWYSKEARRER